MRVRRVVCAALMLNGNLILGPRHFDDTMWRQIYNIYINSLAAQEAKQGFIDQWGEFMTRAEAFEVATAAGQIIKKTGNPKSKELFSEDIY